MEHHARPASSGRHPIALSVLQRTVPFANELGDQGAWRLLVVFAAHRHPALYALDGNRHRGRQSLDEWTLRGILHPRLLPAHRLDRCRQQCEGRQEPGRQQVPRRHQFPALHHPLSAHLYADVVGGQASRCAAQPAYLCGSLHPAPGHRFGLCSVQALRYAGSRMAEGQVVCCSKKTIILWHAILILCNTSLTNALAPG